MIAVGRGFPDDVTYQILAYLEIRHLGIAQQVCKKWNDLAKDDLLWIVLFKRAYKVDVPEGKLGKEALRSVKIIKGEEALQKVVTSFMCQFKWDKKRRLECLFRGKDIPPLIIEQWFGPSRGTEGLKGAVDEENRCEFVGDFVSQEPLALDDETLYMENLPSPDGLPLRESVTSAVSVSVSTCFFTANIEGVDVKYGNTLGFFSDINEWKEPFTLICLHGNDGVPMWIGRIPYSNFKFVKIHPNGDVTWENISTNRSWNSRSSGRPYSWEEYLQAFPIEFSS